MGELACGLLESLGLRRGHGACVLRDARASSAQEQRLAATSLRGWFKRFALSVSKGALPDRSPGRTVRRSAWCDGRATDPPVNEASHTPAESGVLTLASSW